MERNNERILDRGYKPQNIKLTFYSIFLTAVFILELYIMMNDPSDYVLIGIVGLVILIFVFLLVNVIYQIYVQKEIHREEQYSNIFKSEKASYMLLRKNFQELNEKVDNLILNAKTPTEELIHAQKAIAKVTINRNKENANAMLNSNDMLMERIYIFEEKLNQLNHEIGENQKEVAEQSSKQMLVKQNEITSSLRELELSLKNEILKAINAINSQNQIRQVSIEQPIYRQPEEIKDSELRLSEFQSDILTEDINSELELDSSVEDISELQPTEEKSDREIELIPAEEISEIEMDLEPIEEISEIEMELEPIEEISEMEMDLEPVEEINLEKEESIEEEISIPEPVVEEENSLEPAVEEEVITESTPELPPMPDLSDPNKVMSPDEISALFANTVDAGVTLEETVKEEPPVVEEKPPMPDLSNPNKVMSPEEIAALLANM